jgi:hypothetical protein
MTTSPASDAVDIVREARPALDAFLDGLNSHDLEKWTSTLHFPQVRIHEGAVTVWQNPEEYIRASRGELDALLASGWRRSAWEEVEFSNVSADQVHAEVRFSRLDADGRRLAVFESIYVLTRQRGRWGVLARIGFESS